MNLLHETHQYEVRRLEHFGQNTLILGNYFYVYNLLQGKQCYISVF
jgi:hypothetical protein